MRPTFEKLLASGASPDGFFDSAFIKSSLFLEQFALKDEHEKDAYFNSLNASVASFPIDFCKYKILPEVIKALDFGGGGAKALGPILKIGSRLEEADFTTLIVPIITRLFSSPDRAIRVTLCDNLASYIDRLTTKIAIVRESTLKSILVIIPKLTERIINNDLLRHLARLQADPEPGIRTNTTICLGKMAPHLSDAIKKKILAMAFIRSLNDGFPPARKAGLMALAATIDSYDPAEIVQKIIPSMSPLLLDTEKSIRTHTLKNMSLFLKRIEQHAETMPETAAVPKANGTADSAAGAASAAAPASASGASDSWAGWAISAVSSRIVTSVAGRDSPAGSTASPASAPASASVPQLPAPAQGLTAASTRASVQSSSPSRTSTGSPQPGVSSSVGQSSFGQSSFGQSSFGQSTARPASPLSLGRATAPLTLKPSVPALSTDSWDDDWGADLGPAPAAVASKPPIASKPPPAAAASGGESAGWDSWTDDWSAPAAQGSSAAPAAGSAWGATAMPAAAGARPMTPEQREEERQKRREAIAAQREARKAGRLGAKKT
nr:hypothetical protein HK105_002434 [Polyrhizophydium stewartii]